MRRRPGQTIQTGCNVAQSVPSRHPARPKVFTPHKTDEDRKSAAQRGYNQAWTDYAAALRLERVFCELCAALGIETPIAGQTTTATGRKRAQGVVDHVIPVADADDVLFWATDNHWILCQSCNQQKSLKWDGTYGKAKVHATDRTIAGVMRRRQDIVEAMRRDHATQEASRYHDKHDCVVS